MRTVKWNGHDVAEAAAKFPLIEGPQFTDLVESIKRSGLRQPVTRCWTNDTNGTRRPVILDGRNRLRACEAARVKPTFADYDGAQDDRAICLLVADLNIHRRDLDKSARAMIASSLVEMYAPAAHERKAEGGKRSGATRRGEDTPELEDVQTREEAAEEAARAMGVSKALVYQAKRVRTRGDASVIAAVEAGKMKVDTADKVVGLAKPEQRKVMKRIERGERATVAIRNVQIEAAPKPTTAPIHCAIIDAVGAVSGEPCRDIGRAVDALRETLLAASKGLAPDAHVYIFAGQWPSEIAWIVREFCEVQETPIAWVRERARQRDGWFASRHQSVIVARVRGSSRPVRDGASDVFEGDARGLVEFLIESSTVAGEVAADPTGKCDVVAKAASALERGKKAAA